MKVSWFLVVLMVLHLFLAAGGFVGGNLSEAGNDLSFAAIYSFIGLLFRRRGE